ncbi:MAG: ABC transporter permease [Myxococcales bacterium]|nr:ABC transporter permease [Myxococcales bacterium]
MRRLLLIAARNLRQNRKRTALLGIAIASVTALLVLLTSVSNGIQDTMLRAATTLSTGHVNVGGFFKITSGQAAPVVTDYNKVKEFLRKKLPEAREVADRLRGWGKVVSPATSIQVGISGLDVKAEPGLSKVIRVIHGKLEDLSKPSSILLFEKQAKRLEVKVGDGVTISAPTVRGSYNAIDVTVVAIAKDIGLLSGFNVFTPKQTVRDIYLLGANTTGAIHIMLADHRKSAAVADKLRGLLRDAGYKMMEPLAQPFWMKFPLVTREDWTGQKLDVTTWEDEMAFLKWIIATFDGISASVVGILMIIIVVGVMNALWMAIRERTREIGTLRAIGMSRGRVMLMFLFEAMLLSAIFTVVGAIVGVAASGAINAASIELNEGFTLFLMNDTLRLVVAPKSVINGIVTITFVTTLFALYPAYRAARMKPVTAIHHVG